MNNGENKFSKILEESGLTLKQFGDAFRIPYRTLQHWKSGTRSCPEYVLELIEYKIEHEKARD